MMKGTFTVRGLKVRSQSERRFIVVLCVRKYDGVRYDAGTIVAASVKKRSDFVDRAQAWVRKQGFHESREFVVVDTKTGEEVAL